jgi:hypothetical protein
MLDRCIGRYRQYQNAVLSGHIARLDFFQEKSILAEARPGIPILILP